MPCITASRGGPASVTDDELLALELLCVEIEMARATSVTTGPRCDGLSERGADLQRSRSPIALTGRVRPLLRYP